MWNDPYETSDNGDIRNLGDDREIYMVKGEIESLEINAAGGECLVFLLWRGRIRISES